MDEEQRRENPAGLTEIVAGAIRQARKKKGWSAQRLAEEMTRAGVKWEGGIVTKIETGRRRFVTVEELLALAYVLDTAPTALLLGAEPADLARLGDRPYPVAPLVFVDTNLMVEWLTGLGNFYGLGLRRWLTESEEDRRQAQELRWRVFHYENPDEVMRVGDIVKILNSYFESQRGGRPAEETREDDQTPSERGGDEHR